MTPLEKPVHRVTRSALDRTYGPDSGRKLVSSFKPGDLIEIRPLGTRRPESISIFDVYNYAIRMRVNAAQLERARAKKVAKAKQRETREIKKRFR